MFNVSKNLSGSILAYLAYYDINSVKICLLPKHKQNTMMPHLHYTIDDLIREYLTRFPYSPPCTLTALLCVIAAILAAIVLPETLASKKFVICYIHSTMPVYKKMFWC